jgi:hypothetical protein
VPVLGAAERKVVSTREPLRANFHDDAVFASPEVARRGIDFPYVLTMQQSTDIALQRRTLRSQGMSAHISGRSSALLVEGDSEQCWPRKSDLPGQLMGRGQRISLRPR